MRYSDDVEERNLRMVASFSALFFGEILSLVGNRLPGFDPLWVVKVLVPKATAIAAERTD